MPGFIDDFDTASGVRGCLCNAIATVRSFPPERMAVMNGWRFVEMVNPEACAMRTAGTVTVAADAVTTPSRTHGGTNPDA